MNLNNISSNNNLLNNHYLLTKNILNMSPKYILNFLDMEYCQKEYSIFLEGIHYYFNEDQIKLFGRMIGKSIQINDISKYYIKLSHLFSSIFNITSNNFTIKNNNINISFNINQCIPELKYLYTYFFDKNKNCYVFNEKFSQKYYHDLYLFCKIFSNKHKKYDSFNNLSINNVTNKNIENNIIFENYFHKYAHYITILIQNINLTL